MKPTTTHIIVIILIIYHFIAVAAMTISNGGDNIGIYLHLFASYNSSAEVIPLISVFMAMTAVWCATGYYLVSQPSTFREANSAFRAHHITLCSHRAWNIHNDRSLLVLVRTCLFCQKSW